MKKLLSIALLGVSLYSETLKDLINLAENNELTKAYEYTVKAADLKTDSVKQGYLPKIELGYSYSEVNNKMTGEAGNTGVGYAKASFVVFDGFARENRIDSAKANADSAKYNYSAYKKSTALNITNLFYSLKNIEAQIKATEKKGEQLSAEVDRLSKFYNSGTASLDQLEDVKAANALNIYQLASLKGSRDDLQFTLNTLVGRDIKSIESSFFQSPKLQESFERDDLKALDSRVKALDYIAKAEGSNYLPQIVLENTYSQYDFGDDDEPYKSARLDDQNKLTLNIKISEFDFFAGKSKKESAKYEKLSAQSQFNYKKREAQKDIRLALINLETVQKSLEAASLRVKAADSAYDLIYKKRVAGLASNVEYLDALSNKFDAISMYEGSKNNLEVAKANVFYFQGKDIKEMIK